MVRKIFRLVSLSLLLGLFSCGKEPSRESAAPRGSVLFRIEETQTKSDVTLHELGLRHAEVLVFRRSTGQLEGALDATRKGTGILHASMEFPTGVSFNYVVIANGPDGLKELAASLGETAFLQQLSLLTHTTSTSLVMYGSGSFAISTHNPSVIEVSMRRYSCKVSVESLELKWLDAFSTPPSVTLERIVLVNVVGSTPYSAVPAVGETWYNQQGVDGSLPAIVKDITVAEYGSLPVVSSSAVNTLVPLYCMPNPTSNNVNSLNTPAWSPRNTRVALELKVDGVSNWYPVDLPAMLCNRHYLIRKMEVMGPGSQGPDYPVERNDVVFTLEVLPWGDEEIEVSFTD